MSIQQHDVSQSASAASPTSSTSSTATPAKKDHRAAVQAHKLRMDIAGKAIRHGEIQPSVTPRTVKILMGSAIIAAIMLVVTIGAATVIQML
ncbi:MULTISPECIES: hypothetical protein [unclassified Corynebacterium]|uniref:hypothetical protein n=1 Tax=unclassified Corynebacterium TaxID=2624378 RepID=UPI001EF72CAC|nr:MULTISPECIES: hypothetical protein [unclassified Corynebacterium]MCG7258992.1 hypothetical protein [Corynebacterium sp. ACRQK]MCG7264053.1 hypothetical protein [Corynebacterium sp. ACRQL]